MLVSDWLIPTEIIWPDGGIHSLYPGMITHLEPEETEMLWPLIANLERGEDGEALRAAIEDVRRAHNPGVNLKKRIGWSDVDNEDDNDADESDDSDNEDDNDSDESDNSGESDIDKNDSTA